ncbi:MULTISPECIES: hypothetical protein [unclassified Archaeoglobus]|jgi:hypothetical protein|uniref:hypothetical protein n=1 Tax=unclassified Archaeoglobus TaxID=2643606 RepID=UPI0025BD848A|nr:MULTISPECIES: hypothetical protein [unclassified Archaeoglobus]
MVELDGALVQRLDGSDEGVTTLNSFDAAEHAILESPDLWQPPNAYGGTKLLLSFSSNHDGFRTLNDLPSIPPTTLTAQKYGFAVFPRFEGVPRELIGCYRAVDRLALLAFVRRVDGVSIPNADVLFKGNIYKEIGRTNEHGIVGAYLLPDSYNNTIIISPNGIVYEQVELKEIGNGVYQITVRRKTKANATFRQIHRMFD